MELDMIMQKVANCNAHYLHYPLHYFLEHQKALQKGQVEFYGGVPHIFIDHYDYDGCDNICYALRCAGIRVTAFTPRPYGYSLFADPGSEHASATVAYYCNCIRAAKRLGAKIMCISPFSGTLSKSREQLWANLTASAAEICRMAECEDMTLAMGTALPSDSAILHTLAELRQLLAEIASPYLKAMLDTHVIGAVGETIPEWLGSDVLHDNVVHVHLADGQNDEYRVWGDGCYLLADCVAQLLESGYDGSISFFLPGDRYAKAPQLADQRNMEALTYLAGGGKR
jgi:protein FrlC